MGMCNSNGSSNNPLLSSGQLVISECCLSEARERQRWINTSHIYHNLQYICQTLYLAHRAN